MAAPLQNPAINWNSRNLHEEWKQFQQHATLMFKGPLKRANQEEQSAYLLIWVGNTGREIFNSWGLSEEDSKNINTLMERFQQHSAPKKNTVFARYIFQERKQEDEPFDSFITDLRNLVKDCHYDKPEEMVRDKIVSGIKSQEIREKLLTEGDALTMEKAIDIAIMHETTQQRLRSMATTSPTADSIDSIAKNRSGHQQRSTHHRRYKAEQSHTDITNCRNCGGQHAKKKCPAFGKKCSYCQKLNHWAKVCLTKKDFRSKAIHTVDEDDDDDDIPIFIDAITKGNDSPDTAYANIAVSTGDTVRFKLDTGAQANIMPSSVYTRLRQMVPLQPSTSKLFGYTGKQLTVQGSITLDCSYKGHNYRGVFHIVDTPTTSQPVLGLKACLQLELIKMILSIDSTTPMTRDSVIREYSQLFTGLGELEGEVTLHLKPDATPVVHPARRVPHAIRGRLKEELDKMESTGVIEKVTTPTDWVNSLVVVEKPNGKLRICLDPKDLNAAIKRPHYPMPTLDDAVSKMAGARYFTKLDAKSGYWQMKLSKDSSYLTTFNTPFGRYRFLRLPFGIVSAQDDFQRKMDETFEGIPGVTSLVDDVIVFGKTQEDHDANLQATLERATIKNLKLNPEKLTVGAQEVEYFGHIISADGLRPDPTKVKAIQDMPPPNDKKELQTLLGMITYLAKFTPQLSEITKPMRDLLKENIEFIWDTPQQTALRKVKDAITSQPILAFFDPHKEITLEVDASKSGLGAAIFQEGKPVAFASKSLTPTEEKYAQIEKELYAVLFGCRRFHQYLYGQEITVRTDHKPLESITKKALATAPPRLQRMLLQLQKYNLKIVHIPGKEIPVADTLSRKYLPPEPEDNMTDDLDLHVHMVTKNLPVSDQKMKQLRLATSADTQLQSLMSVINLGWPEARSDCPPNITEFWNFRDELSVIDGIILKGHRILVPKALRAEMLDKIHSSHLGIEKTKQRAREILFWPGMATDIHQHVAMCSICAPKAPSNPKEPLISHTVPSRPWQKVGIDLFAWDMKTYLVTVDYYSRFFEVDELLSTTSAAVIRKLSSHFARHGIPETVISDNGPQFASDEFLMFATNWDFEHQTSSPGYPQSNGLAEKTVQTIKNILSKAKSDGQCALLSILEYRSTPVDGLASPAQLLMGRQLRSILPSTNQQLKPKTVDHNTFLSRRMKLQAEQKAYYDRSAYPLPPLKTGDPVYVQMAKGDWKPAQITATAKPPRSFQVRTDDGAEYRRNRRFLKQRPTREPTSPGRTTPLPAAIADERTITSKEQTHVSRYGRTIKTPQKMNL